MPLYFCLSEVFINIMHYPTPNPNPTLNPILTSMLKPCLKTETVLWSCEDHQKCLMYMTLTKFHLKLQALFCILLNLTSLYSPDNQRWKWLSSRPQHCSNMDTDIIFTLVSHCEVNLKYNLLKLATVRAPEQHSDIKKNVDLEGNCDSCPYSGLKVSSTQLTAVVELY